MGTQLQTIIAESGLEATKADTMLKQFADYFEIAADWERKAKTIVVTDVSQTADMAMARVGRLFLREKRTAVEKTRKELKEQSLREGKAIDGIANVLKALIVPIEEYLDKQEHFAEIKEAEEKARLAAEEAARIEAERMAKEKAEAEERERIRAENARLKQEAEARERAMVEERKAIEEKARKEREAVERKARAEQAAKDREISAIKAKAEAARKAAEEAARQERLKAQALADVERQKAEAAERQRLIEKQKADAQAKAEREELERQLAETVPAKPIRDNLAEAKKIHQNRERLSPYQAAAAEAFVVAFEAALSGKPIDFDAMF